MIAIVHSIYSQSVHAPALDAGLMDNDAERYCTCLQLIYYGEGGGGQGGFQFLAALILI